MLTDGSLTIDLFESGAEVTGTSLSAGSLELFGFDTTHPEDPDNKAD